MSTSLRRGDHAQALANQVVRRRIRIALRMLVLRGAAVRFRDTVRVDRVRLDHLRDVLPRQPFATRHRLEERRHAIRIEARARHEADADAIRFVFVRAREVHLLLSRRALRDGDRALHGIAAARHRADEHRPPESPRSARCSACPARDTCAPCAAE